jgi:hypothetical protein
MMRSSRRGTFLEVTGGGEAPRGCAGRRAGWTMVIRGDVPLSPMSSSLIRWSYCWLPPILPCACPKN